LYVILRRAPALVYSHSTTRLSALGALEKWSAVAATLSRCRIADDRRPGKFFKEVREAVSIGAVVFVAGVRPSTKGRAKAKEPRS